MADQLYHLANIRDLLLNGFNDLELRRLCYDVPHFRPVYQALAHNTGHAQIVDELLQYAESQLLIDTLLALAKERNPARYERHGPYYYDNPTPIIQKQLSDLAIRLAALTSPAPLTREQQHQIALHWRELGGKDSLRGFDLEGIDLSFVDLSGAILCQANLRHAKLAGAHLRGADLRGADLFQAVLSTAQLDGVSMALADLSGANLTEANLHRANLTGANLTGANLSNATVYDTCLRGANLTEANLRGAKISASTVSGTKNALKYSSWGATLTGAIMPDGTKHE